MRNSIFVTLIIATMVLVSSAFSAPVIINYQGQLTDALGDPVTDGLYSITFSIYDDPSAGSMLWTSGARQVNVSGGLFTYLLGENVPLQNFLFATDSSLWLGITLTGEPEISPRSILSSTPRAAVSTGVYGDIKTSRGQLLLEDGGTDSSIVVSNSVSSVDHHGHVTILKIANNGGDTTSLVDLFGDPDFPRTVIGDDNNPDSGTVTVTGVDKHKHKGHVTILKIANGGSDTTGLVELFGDPDFQQLVLGDDEDLDSGTVTVTGVDKHKHKGHVTILKIANGGSDTTGLVELFGDPDFQQLVLGDGDLDSGTVTVTGVDKHKHKGHVTILKIASGGTDTTGLVELFGDPDFQQLVLGDDEDPDSGTVAVTGVDKHKHKGHVTILKIAGGGSDTTGLVELFGDPDFQQLVLGDGGDPDSGTVAVTGVDKHKHKGHVTILKIANGGSDTTGLVELFGDPDFQQLKLGDDNNPDSGIVVLSSVDKHRHHGHVTILKIANGGSDTTDIISLSGNPDFPAMEVYDIAQSDTGIIVSNTIEKHKHRGHVTILKIANNGGDTTDVVDIFGDADTASIQLNGGGGSGGSILLTANDGTNSGRIGINTLTPAYELDIVGTMCATGGMCQQSDRRLKENITPVENGLSILQSLNPVRYDWRYDEYPEKRLSKENQVGFIAQEVQAILPELVSEGSDGILAMDYGRLTPVLVKAVKEQQETIESQSQDIEDLRNEIEKLSELVTKLASQNNIKSETQYGSK